MIEVRNLTKRYGTIEVLKNISFKIESGSIYGFLGRNGAGKTTTMNILTGLSGYDAGEILVDNMNLGAIRRKIGGKIGYLPENPAFYNYMNPVEYLSFIADIRGMKNKDSQIGKLLEIVNLKDAAKKRIGRYSRGMRQRLGIASALLGDPEIVFLDEPTSALDPEGRLDVLDMILKLKKQGKTVFLSTHILNDAERVCDHLSIIDKGKIIISASLDELKKKYTLPIYDIEFEKACGEIKDKFSDISWIDSIKVKNNTASIYVNDIDKAKSRLIYETERLNNPVISFRIRESSLEDIFIRMVKHDADI
ncbi:MAG TPA: ABC transporter ATP-binding protein [Clostridiaceae bacterium]|nr:ABC transporter ATP-binding protein [Clostridiaceae bacterium]